MKTTELTQAVTTAPAAVLTISGLRLVLPEREIHAQEAVSAVDARQAEPYSVGWLQHAQQRWPVYCLSQELSLLAAMPAERSTCALLGTHDGYMGILCDEVSTGQSIDPQQDLPPAMHMPDTPIQGLIALDEDRIACVTSAERLAAHVARMAGA
jgi:chemotaxis signal transduction protein